MSCQGECNVEGWHYEMNPTHPRMYGRCTECGDFICHVLPRKKSYIDPDVDSWTFERIHEKALCNQPLRQTVWSASHDPIRFQPALIEAIEDRMIALARTEIRDDAEELAKRINDATAEARKALDYEWDQADQLVSDLRRLSSQMQSLIEGAEDSIYRALQRGRFQYPSPDSPPVPLQVICDDRHIQPTVYGLIDPNEPERVRYVGQTLTPGSRFSSHASDKAAPKVREWVRSINTAPLMVLIENPHRLELDDREMFWIRYYRQRDMADLNTSVRMSA